MLRSGNRVFRKKEVSFSSFQNKIALGRDPKGLCEERQKICTKSLKEKN